MSKSFSSMIGCAIGVSALLAAASSWAGGSAPRGGPARDEAVVPEGPFTMGNDPGKGNPDEVPAHRPRISRFWIDRHEVTNGEFRRCVQLNGCSEPAAARSKTRSRYYGARRFDRFPVVNVSWYQAAAYCKWVGGRLPTEAEWEKAARGDRDRRQYPWGDEPPTCERANFGGEGGCGGDTAEVGGREAGKSPYGAHDMAGNVWEWVADWYDSAYYRNSPSANPSGPRWGSFKVMRGGCFDTAAEGLRVSCRNRDLPTSAQTNVGFRCARPTR